MKTIEERVNQWAVLPLSDADRRNLMRMALIELADDLNAEKEKEVAELRGELAEAISNSERNFLDAVRIAHENESLLEEVKRVLAMAENRALDWDMLGRAHGNSAVQMWREDALKLLTRLGGSHE